MCGAHSSREIGQKLQFFGSLSSQGRRPQFQVGNPQTQARSDLGRSTSSGSFRLHAHKKQHTCSCRVKYQPKECWRERRTLSALVLGRGMERWTVTCCCSGYATERLFERGAEVCWAGTLFTAALTTKGQGWKQVLLPLNIAGQGDQKIAQQRNFWPQPIIARKPEDMQDGEREIGTVSTMRAVVWELDRQ